jgi:hypothetical protein
MAHNLHLNSRDVQKIYYWPVSCERDSFAKGGKSLLQRRKTALLGSRVNETFPWREENSRSHDTGPMIGPELSLSKKCIPSDLASKDKKFWGIQGYIGCGGNMRHFYPRCNAKAYLCFVVVLVLLLPFLHKHGHVNKQDWKGFQSLAANIFVKLVPTTYLVFEIPICKMESQILALKIAIGISNTNWCFKYQLVLQITIGTSNTMSNDPPRRRTTKLSGYKSRASTTCSRQKIFSPFLPRLYRPAVLFLRIIRSKIFALIWNT